MPSFFLARLERFWTLSGPVLLAMQPIQLSATTETPKHPMRAPMRRGQGELPAVSVSAVKMSACGKASACESLSGTLEEARDMAWRPCGKGPEER